MGELLRSSLSGIGQGSMFGLLAIGIVIIYRGSGVLNLAQGALAMIGAFSFQQVLTRFNLPNLLAAALAIILSCLLVLIAHEFVMRPLERAPTLAKVVATLGFILVAQPGIELITGSGSVEPPHLLDMSSPVFSGPVNIFGTPVPKANLWLLGIAVALTVGLAALYRWSRFGMVAQAVWENPKGASLLGYSVNTVSRATWMLGTALAAFAGILISGVQAGGLTVTNLTLLVIPALAAALLARFTSFTITLLAGIVIGMAESYITYLVAVYPSSWLEPGLVPTLPLFFIVLALVFRGNTIPTRGEDVGTARLPEAPRPRGRAIPFMLVAVSALVVVLLFTTGVSFQGALTNSLIGVVLALSVVVITGFMGQMSIAPIALAGISAFFTAKLSTSLGLPMIVALPLSVLLAVPVGILIGLPSVRVRGVSLAVVTLSAGVAIENLILQSTSLAGGYSGLNVPDPTLFGIDFSANTYPIRFGCLVLFFAVAGTLVVRNLRRGAVGHRMLAIRGNELAATASGINVPRTKLLGFGIGAGLAGLAGTLMAYQGGSVQWESYDVLISILIIGAVYIGGVGTVAGAWIAGVSVTSGVIQELLNFGPNYVLWVNLVLGLLLLATLVRAPDGIAVTAVRQLNDLRASFAARRSQAKTDSSDLVDTSSHGDRVGPAAASSGTNVSPIQASHPIAR